MVFKSFPHTHGKRMFHTSLAIRVLSCPGCGPLSYDPGHILYGTSSSVMSGRESFLAVEAPGGTIEQTLSARLGESSALEICGLVSRNFPCMFHAIKGQQDRPLTHNQS